MTASSGWLEVGRVDRAHGLRGEVLVTLVTNRLERVEPGAVLRTDHADLVIRSSRPHQHRWIVHFDGVDDREASDRLRGAVLYAEPLDDPDALWAHELIGVEVVDSDGRTHGRVEAVEANPASDLLVLDSGVLVPLHFIVSGPESGSVVVDAPRGLFDDGGDES